MRKNGIILMHAYFEVSMVDIVDIFHYRRRLFFRTLMNNIEKVEPELFAVKSLKVIITLESIKLNLKSILIVISRQFSSFKEYLWKPEINKRIKIYG